MDDLMKKKIEETPYITLKEELTSREMKEYRKAIKHYAKEHGIHLDALSHRDIYNVAKLLNWDKFIFHD